MLELCSARRVLQYALETDLAQDFADRRLGQATMRVGTTGANRVDWTGRLRVDGRGRDGGVGDVGSALRSGWHYFVSSRRAGLGTKGTGAPTQAT